jgi:hypothetical protein
VPAFLAKLSGAGATATPKPLPIPDASQSSLVVLVPKTPADRQQWEAAICKLVTEARKRKEAELAAASAVAEALK